MPVSGMQREPVATRGRLSVGQGGHPLRLGFALARSAAGLYPATSEQQVVLALQGADGDLLPLGTRQHEAHQPFRATAGRGAGGI